MSSNPDPITDKAHYQHLSCLSTTDNSLFTVENRTK